MGPHCCVATILSCIGSSSSVVELIQAPRPVLRRKHFARALVVAAIWSVCVEESDKAVDTGRQVVLRNSFESVVSIRAISMLVERTACVAREESKCL
jgi:hypothetical protein